MTPLGARASDDWQAIAALVIFAGTYFVLAVGGCPATGSIAPARRCSAPLSNVVSNVPAVLVLRPFVAGLGDSQHAWLVVAMASTLAGNLTLVGSVANLIVAQRARRYGVRIGFWPYFQVGAPLTLLTILFGLWWL
jgi:Na+/H+ antiporter NhaD/arsenite permease-like protein